jgi:hypothetical protein
MATTVADARIAWRPRSKSAAAVEPGNRAGCRHVGSRTGIQGHHAPVQQLSCANEARRAAVATLPTVPCDSDTVRPIGHCLGPRRPALLGSGVGGCHLDGWGMNSKLAAAAAGRDRFNSGRVGPRTDHCRRVRRNSKLRLRALKAGRGAAGVLLLRSATLRRGPAGRPRAAPFIVRCSERELPIHLILESEGTGVRRLCSRPAGREQNKRKRQGEPVQGSWSSCGIRLCPGGALRRGGV